MVDAALRGRVEVVKTSLREVGGALRAVARLRLGLEEAGRHETGREGGSRMFEQILQDVRHAGRTLRRNPGFTVSAVFVLALGIGATAAIFSAVNAFFFRPLPFADPDRLVLLYETNPEFGWTDAQVAPANALDWREEVDAFSDLAMYANMGAMDVTLHIDDEPVLVGGIGVTGNFFSVLGVDAALGRTFRFEETWEGNDAVAVISHDLWTSRFGGDPGIVGSLVPLGGAAQPVEIVGVMPAGFTFPDDETALWYTYGWAPSNREEVWFRRAHSGRAVARLESGVSLEEADAQLQVVVRRLQQEYPATNAVMGAGLMPVRDFEIRGVRTPLLVLLGAVAILLFLACANVANLMLVRADGRSREVALRHALGAGRSRVVRQFLTESVLLGCSGGVLGLAMGWLGVQGMARMTRLGIDGATQIALDARVVGFTLLVAIASGVLFGIPPAVRGGRGNLQGALREGGHGHSVGRKALRLTGLLVSIEVALALVLVVGAGLMVRSAWTLRQVDPGFHVDGVVAVRLSIPTARYPGRSEVLEFWDRVTEALEARPGIVRAGTVANLPLAGASWSSSFQAEGWPPDRVGFEILHRRADRGYFEALDIPLLRGRLFESTDGPDDQLVVVINETLAREHFPNEDPVGQRIAYDRAPTAESIWYEIIGIVGDQHQTGLNVPPRAEVFENRNQDWGRIAWVVIRTSVGPLSVMPAVRNALDELDSQIPIGDVRPLRDVWSASMDGERFILTLLTIFGVTALLLATVGVYGVTAQAARRRTHEIGIRIALGASASEVVGMMLRHGLSVVALGLFVGLVSALLASRALSSLVFGIEPNDPATLASVVTLLGVAALAACYVPARRATTVDPVSSLNVE
jgi:predicted permease